MITQCCCAPPTCVLSATSTEPGLCDSDTDYGIWSSGYGAYPPTPTVVIKNSSGTVVSNGSSQPEGTYTITSTVPTTLCVEVPLPPGGGDTAACIDFAGTTTTMVTHDCPGDTSHTVPAPAFTGWQVVLYTECSAVSNDSDCGSTTAPTGTGTVSGTGQTFSIPNSSTVLNSDGDSLTISGTYTLSGTICCNSNGPGSSLFTTDYTVTGTFSFPFCNGPCAELTFSFDCVQRTIGEGGGVYVSGGVIYSYCTPDGLTVVSSSSFGDLGNSPTPPITPPDEIVERASNRIPISEAIRLGLVKKSGCGCGGQKRTDQT